MKRTHLISFAVACSLCLVAGCGPGGSTMTKNEMDSLKNPSREIPPQAVEAMKHQGELQQKQMEANRAAGVDSRGIPLSKSTEPVTNPTGTSRGSR